MRQRCGEMRLKIYEKAREYWRRTGNQERLALTDRELDEQFRMLIGARRFTTGQIPAIP
jgi:hypothetical protein